MVYCPKGAEFQHFDCKARNRSHRGHANVVRVLLAFSSEAFSSRSVAPGSLRSSRSTTLKRKAYIPTEARCTLCSKCERRCATFFSRWGRSAPSPRTRALADRAGPSSLSFTQLRRDAHVLLRRIRLLVFRCALRPPAAPGARNARHFLPLGPCRGAPASAGLLRAGLQDPRARRLWLGRVPRALVRRRVAQAPPPHAHDRILRAHALQARGTVPRRIAAGRRRRGGTGTARRRARLRRRWLPPCEAVQHRPCVPQRDHGRDASGGIPPSRGRRRGPRSNTRRSNWSVPAPSRGGRSRHPPT